MEVPEMELTEEVPWVRGETLPLAEPSSPDAKIPMHPGGMVGGDKLVGLITKVESKLADPKVPPESGE